MEKKTLDLYDGNYIKFKQDGKDIAVLILRDESPSNPRRDWDNPDTMVCFHPRYNLGDEHKYSSMADFFTSLVKECLTPDVILQRVLAGNTKLEIAYDEGKPVLIEHFTLCGRKEAAAIVTTENMDEMKQQIVDALEDLDESTLYSLLSEDEVAILPLYLYDHSGITMNTTGFLEAWDTSKVGCICMTKKQYTGNKYEEAEWPAKAYEILKADVETYDQFLTGEVYGYQTFEMDDDLGWVEGDDSCWGFFGNDILTNGITDYVSGLKAAIESGAYETGTATEHRVTTVTYDFN